MSKTDEGTPAQSGSSSPDQRRDRQGDEDAHALCEQALSALRQGNLDLAELTLSHGEARLTHLVEELRGNQAALVVQNEELTRVQQETKAALDRFTAFFMSLPVAELVVDHNGLIIEANAEARHLLDLRDTRAHCYSLARLVHDDDRGRIAETWEQLHAQETTQLLETRLRNGGGRPLIADLVIARLPSADPLPPRFICALIDRSDAVRQRDSLSQAYDRLESSEERYRVLADSSPDWDYWLGSDGSFVHISPACQEVTGYSAEEFMSDRNLLEHIIHPDDLPGWRAHMARVIDSAEPDQTPLQLRIRSRDGDQRWIEHACNRVVSEDGRFLGRRGINRDITRRVEADAALRASERKYRALFESASEGMAILQGGRYTAINRSALAMLGQSDPQAVLRRRPRDISPALQSDGEETAKKEQRLLELAHQQGRLRFEWQHLRADGSELTAEVRALDVDIGGEPTLLLTWNDLTERHVAATRDAQARTVFENTSLGIIITDPVMRISAVNRAFTEITGFSEQEVLGRTPRILKSQRQDTAFYQAMWASMTQTGQWRGELWNRRKNGEVYPQLTSISAVYDEDGRLTNYVSVFGDITQTKRSEAALYKLAHEDPLTGLPNRALLRARLEQSLSRAERNGSMLGVLFLDLDMFKNINDTLGHPVGDALLKRIADAIARRIRGADSVARLGGDEFVVLMEDIQDPNAAAQLARRLLEAFSTPFDALGHALQITTSIGISIYPVDGGDMESLLRNADVAMYQAKQQGRNTYRFFEERMSEGALERQRIEHALSDALARDEFSLEYQPQVALAGGSLIGTEVLLRWRHPLLGQVAPSRFIPIAEELGLISKLGNWVLERACGQLAAWDAAGLRIGRMAVNLSRQQLERTDLVDSVSNILSRRGIAGDRLEFDVLEAVFLRHAERVIDNLEALRALGISIAVDDFGVGFSSLGTLTRLPINRLKIDKTFVDNLSCDRHDAAVVRAIIALGRCLGLDVLAEGVESREQADFLLQAGCVAAQGYVFGRPMSAADLFEQFADR